VTDLLDRDLATLDEVDARLEERSRTRRQARERRERRRLLVQQWLGNPVRVPLLALAGTVVLEVMLSASGGDLSTWSEPLALAALTMVFLGPAAFAGRLARSRGRVTALTAGVTTFGLQLLLTFVGAFLILGAGPP
jgi:hypothetical protein